MKRHHRFSLFKRFAKSGSDHGTRDSDSGLPGRTPGHPASTMPAEARLTGATLEQAYRDLLLENQVLAESNQRLHERLARRDSGLEESPAAKELIRAQRNALAERSRRLRELEYENKGLQREQKKLVEENRKLAASLARHMQDIQPLLRKDESSRRELADTKAALREKINELHRLTDKYYQLEARSKPQPPPSTAANSRF